MNGVANTRPTGDHTAVINRKSGPGLPFLYHQLEFSIRGDTAVIRGVDGSDGRAWMVYAYIPKRTLCKYRPEFLRAAADALAASAERVPAIYDDTGGRWAELT